MTNENNPIQNYAEIVLQYLELERVCSTCKTQQDWQRCANFAELYLPDGFHNEHTDLELFSMVMLEFKNTLLNVTYDLLQRIDSGQINVRDGE
jgi:hypothetical protein